MRISHYLSGLAFLVVVALLGSNAMATEFPPGLHQHHQDMKSFYSYQMPTISNTNVALTIPEPDRPDASKFKHLTPVGKVRAFATLYRSYRAGGHGSPTVIAYA